jgi:hypothetical protein
MVSFPFFALCHAGVVSPWTLWVILGFDAALTMGDVAALAEAVRNEEQ